MLELDLKNSLKSPGVLIKKYFGQIAIEYEY